MLIVCQFQSLLTTLSSLIVDMCSQKCDGFMVASTKTDRELGTINIPHEGPEEYNNIWQKVRSMPQQTILSFIRVNVNCPQ